MKCDTCSKPRHRDFKDYMQEFAHLHLHNEFAPDLRPHLFTIAPPGCAKSFGVPRTPPPTLLQAHSRKIARLLARHTSTWINGQRHSPPDIPKIGPCPWTSPWTSSPTSENSYIKIARTLSRLSRER